MWRCRLFVFAESAATAFCFCFPLKTPARIISKYLHIGYIYRLIYTYWPWRIYLVIFLRFLASLAKSKMAAKILCRSLELQLLHGFASCFV